MSRERELLKQAMLMLQGVQLLDGVGNSNCGNLAKEIEAELAKPEQPARKPLSNDKIWQTASRHFPAGQSLNARLFARDIEKLLGIE